MPIDPDDDDLAGFARCCAQVAHENYFSNHFGIFYCRDTEDDEDPGTLVIFNNQPYPDHPLLRDQELDEIRRRLREEGVMELAYATYPQGGPADGHTFALVLDVGEDWEDLVTDLVTEAMEVCRKRDGL